MRPLAGISEFAHNVGGNHTESLWRSRVWRSGLMCLGSRSFLSCKHNIIDCAISYAVGFWLRMDWKGKTTTHFSGHVA